MSVLGAVTGLASGMKDFYLRTNPATLSGAIDVVVVKQVRSFDLLRSAESSSANTTQKIFFFVGKKPYHAAWACCRAYTMVRPPADQTMNRCAWRLATS
jgi:hypothetical protein